MSGTRGVAGLALVFALGACGGQDAPPPRSVAALQDVTVPVPPDVKPTPALPARFGGIGRAATSAEVRPWNIDANPSGIGLPPGRGTHAAGAKLFAAQCAACHGTRGEGMATFPRLPAGESSPPKLRKNAPSRVNWWFSETDSRQLRPAAPASRPIPVR